MLTLRRSWKTHLGTNPVLADQKTDFRRYLGVTAADSIKTDTEVSVESDAIAEC